MRTPGESSHHNDEEEVIEDVINDGIIIDDPIVDTNLQEPENIRDKTIEKHLPDGTYFRGTTEQYNKEMQDYLDRVS